MAWLRSEEEAEQLIEEMLKKGKGKYITQGVVFNKTNPREMELLKKALMSATSFSGLTKEMLTHKFNGISLQQNEVIEGKTEEIKKKDTGNFL